MKSTIYKKVGAERIVRNLLFFILPFALIIAAATALLYFLTNFPYPDHSTTSLTESILISQTEAELASHISTLSETIGERNISNKFVELKNAENYIYESLLSYGLQATRYPYTTNGKEVVNIEAIVQGKTSETEVIVIGAHYDSAIGTAGANDNASGVAALLLLAKRLSESRPNKTIYFVAFTNEEPPHFQTDKMGSYVYAKMLREKKVPVKLMISLETMGFYSDDVLSQKYPWPLGHFYPNKGNFIAFVGNIHSYTELKELIVSFRSKSDFPSEGGSLPGFVPGVGWSDHWSFWEFSFPAVMLTDTALFRYPHYHRKEDLPDKVDIKSLAKITISLGEVLSEL